MSKPILFYSDYCKHSNHLVSLLRKHPEVVQKIITINIDPNQQTKQRPNIFYSAQRQLGIQIIEVPTLIIDQNVLTGADCFRWLDHVTTVKKDVEVKAFSQNEMGSISDIYAKVGTTDINDALEQQFKKYGEKDEPIQCQQSDNQQSKPNQNSNINYDSVLDGLGNIPRREQQMNWTQTANTQVGESQQDRLSKLKMQTGANGDQRRPPRDIDFSNPNFGLEGKMRDSNQLDSRFLDDSNSFNPNFREHTGNNNFNSDFGSQNGLNRRQSEKQNELESKMARLQRERELDTPNNRMNMAKEPNFQSEFF